MEFLDAVIDGLTRHSYMGLYVLILACSLGFPFSKSVSILAAGVLASNGIGSLYAYIVVGVAGLVTGDSVYFLLGYLGGEQALKWRCFATPGFQEGLRRAEGAFKKRDWWAVFCARFVPYLRNAVYLLAGLSRMTPVRFFISNITSAFILAAAFCLAGFYLAEHRESLAWYVKRVEGGLALVLAIVLVILFIVFRKSRSNGKNSNHKETSQRIP